MNGRRIRYRTCGCALVLLATAALPLVAPAAEPAIAVETQAPAVADAPRLAPLGLEQLMQIEVTTVTRAASTVGASAAAVHVITQEDIRRSGATTIAELFRQVPGMNVARIDNNKWAVSARGFNERFANKLLVQIDGRVLYNPLFSGVYWDAVDYPLEDIERIEVIRGPGASLWGANAVNGIVNIITKSTKDTEGGLLSAGGGDEEKGFATARYGGKVGDDLSFRLYGKGFDREAQFSPAGDLDDEWQGGSGGFRLDWQKSERDLLTFQGDLLRSEAGSTSLVPQRAPPFHFTSDEPETTTDGNLLGRWTRRLAGDSSWTVQLYWERFERELESADVDLEWDTWDLDFQHQFSWGNRHRLVYGLGYRYIDIMAGDSGTDDGFFISWNRNDRHQQVVSAFVHDEIELIDRVTLTLGSKFEHNDSTGFEVQPTLRLLWTPSPRQSLWAAVSRAVRTPSESEQGVSARSIPVSTVLPVFPLVVGSSDQDAEKLWAFELGHRLQANEKISLDTALFYNRYDDLSTVLPGAVEAEADGTLILPLTLVNGLDAETYGAELAATWQVSRRWRLYTAYTFLKMHVEPDRSGLPADADGIEEQSPEHHVYLQSSWDLPGDVELDLMGRYVDRVTALMSGASATAEAIDAYLAVDARLAWNLTRDLTLEVVGRNLFDERHREFGANPFLRSEPAEIERSVYGKVTWRF